MDDDERLRVWASVATMLERLPTALDAQLQRDAGLTHFEFGVLTALAAAPDRTLRMSTIAAYASCTLSRLSRAVGRLERPGWVRRFPDPTDGRFTLAELTASGRHKVEQATPGHRELVDRVVFGALTAAQIRQLGTASERITAAVGPDTTWRPPS